MRRQANLPRAPEVTSHCLAFMLAPVHSSYEGLHDLRREWNKMVVPRCVLILVVFMELFSYELGPFHHQGVPI